MVELERYPGQGLQRREVGPPCPLPKFLKGYEKRSSRRRMSRERRIEATASCPKIKYPLGIRAYGSEKQLRVEEHGLHPVLHVDAVKLLFIDWHAIVYVCQVKRHYI